MSDLPKQSINGINKKYAEEITNSDKRIHEIYNEIKKKENIDTDELESFQRAIKQLENSIKDIYNNKALVTRYKDEVLPNFNKIPLIEDQLALTIKQRDNDRDYFEKELIVVEEKLIEIRKMIEKWKSYTESFEKFEIEISQIILNTNRTYDAYLDDEIVILLNSKKNINILWLYIYEYNEFI